MKILPNPSLRLLSLDRGQPAVRNWQVGQVLTAVANTPNRNGVAQLQIGNQRLNAQIPFPVRSGERLFLEVIRQGTTPLLRPLREAPSNNLVRAALRAALPRQTNPTPLLANITRVAAGPRGRALPGPVSEAARELHRALPRAQQVRTGGGLARAVRESGMLLESRLARGAQQRRAPDVQHDFKAGLLRLRQALVQAINARATDKPPPAQTQGPTRPGPATPTATREPATPVRPGTPPARPATQRTANPGTRPADPATPRPTPAASKNAATWMVSALPRPPRLPPAATAPSKTGLPPVSTARSPTAPPQPAPAGQPERGGEAARPVPPPLRHAPLQALVRAVPTLTGREALGTMLAQLLEQTEGALARLALTQLASLPEAEESRPLWLLELPVRRGAETDWFSLRIRQEAGTPADEDEPEHWRLELAFDLPGLGPVQAELRLSGARLATRFWSERIDTVRLFNNHLSELETNLRDAGMLVSSLHCQLGTPPEPAGPQAPGGLQHGLLDEQV